MGYSKKTTNYIKELRKFRDLPKNEKLKHMLKFQEQQNKINVEDVKVEKIISTENPITQSKANILSTELTKFIHLHF